MQEMERRVQCFILIVIPGCSMRDLKRKARKKILFLQGLHIPEYRSLVRLYGMGILIQHLMHSE